MTNGVFCFSRFPGSSPWHKESWWRITWRTTWSEMRSKTSFLPYTGEQLPTPQEPENASVWATPRHDGNIRIILTEKANLAVGRPAIGGLPRKPSRFKFTDPAWTHRPIQRCYEPGQLGGHKEALLEWKVKNWSKNGLPLPAPHQQPKVQLVHFGSKAWQHWTTSAVSGDPTSRIHFRPLKSRFVISKKWLQYIKLLTWCHQPNIPMIKVLKNRITAWEAWSDGAAHCVESTSQGWHRPGCTLLHSHVMQTLEQRTRIASAAPDTAALSTSCLLFRSSWPLLLLHQPISFLFSIFNGPTASIFLRDLLQLLGTFLYNSFAISLSLSSQWVMKKDSVTQTSFPDINLGFNLNPRNTPSTSILLAVGWEYATNWNTIQPCLPSSKPWYSPEQNKPQHSGPKDTKNVSDLEETQGKKPVDHGRPEKLPPFDEAIPHLVSPRFRWTLKPAPSSGRWEGWPAWNLKFWRSMLWRSRISANWNQSKNCFLTFAIWLYQAIMPSCNYLRYWPQSPPFQIPLQVVENIKTSRFQSPCIRKCPGCACVCMLHENHQHIYIYIWNLQHPRKSNTQCVREDLQMAKSYMI